MEIGKVTNVMKSLRGLSFYDSEDVVTATKHPDGVGFAYISLNESNVFPVSKADVGGYLKDKFQDMTFIDILFGQRMGHFDGNIYGWIGAIPGLEHRTHKEELLYVIESIASSFPRKGYGLGEKRPIYFIHPRKDFDFLLGAKGYKKAGNRRWKELR